MVELRLLKMIVAVLCLFMHKDIVILQENINFEFVISQKKLTQMQNQLQSNKGNYKIIENFLKCQIC